MSGTILATEEVVVIRQEGDFDRACDAAYRMAVQVFGIDGNGHAEVKGWERSSCCVRVVFQSYARTGGMGGHEHIYTFRAEAAKTDE